MSLSCLAYIQHAVDGGEYLFRLDAEDAFRVAEYGAFVARARLAGKRFENDLVRRVGPWIPMIAV